jgi:hypothetical protein
MLYQFLIILEIEKSLLYEAERFKVRVAVFIPKTEFRPVAFMIFCSYCKSFMHLNNDSL